MKNRSLCFNSTFKVRADPATDGGEEKQYIEGYFVVYNTEVELWPGYFEQIASGALDDSIKNNDIRCLFNHDTGFVLGRTGNGTVVLKSDDKGLFATVTVNPNDRMAMDVYERVKRGDISTCSFGFWDGNGTTTEYSTDEDGTVHSIVKIANTFEISICPFPAYEDTEIAARSKAIAAEKSNKISTRKKILKQRLEALHNAKAN